MFGLSILVACTPAVSTEPVIPTNKSPIISTTTPEIESTATSPPTILPSVTTTLFAEQVKTRVPGTLTPTQVFPTITPFPKGQRIWFKGNPLPTHRLELSSAELNGRIYVAGGSHEKGLTYARMEVYDPLTDAWSTAAPMPISRHHFGMAALDGKIYVSGGLPDWFRITDTCFVYDPATDSWSAIAPLPHRLATHSMASLDGKLYVVGGNNAPIAGGPMEMFVYDAATDTWDDSLTPMPTGREHLAVVAAEGKLYVLGGRIQMGANLAIVEIYDPQSDTWTRGPDMPVAVSGFTAAYLDGRIHATGGEDLFAMTVMNAHQVLDLATMTWEEWPELPGARHGVTSQAANGQWIVIGGSPRADMGMTGRVDIFVP
ncbi:MAG TPA: kelch repeat-containing protein [Anaerolineales bacterium]|nr:kelch repeat-containing protein [Anaerolineales bacterium]